MKLTFLGTKPIFFVPMVTSRSFMAFVWLKGINKRQKPVSEIVDRPPYRELVLLICWVFAVTGACEVMTAADQPVSCLPDTR